MVVGDNLYSMDTVKGPSATTAQQASGQRRVSPLYILCCGILYLYTVGDVASWAVSGDSWRESGPAGDGWVCHQSSDQSGSSSPQSAKVSALAGRPALGAASASPPQLSGIAASGTLNCCSLGPQTFSLGPQDRSRAFDSLNWSLSDYRVDGDYGPSHSFTRYPVIGSVFETTSELASRQYRTDTGRLA